MFPFVSEVPFRARFEHFPSCVATGAEADGAKVSIHDGTPVDTFPGYLSTTTRHTTVSILRVMLGGHLLSFDSDSRFNACWTRE